MDTPSSQDIRQAAERELTNELFRELVDQEKARLRAKVNRKWWQRLLDLLPFTITIARKPK